MIKYFLLLSLFIPFAEGKEDLVKIPFPEEFRGKTKSLHIASGSKEQNFLFCCQVELDLPRASTLHLRLGESEAYSPLNHSTENELLCSQLTAEQVAREKLSQNNPLLLHLKMTVVMARSEEIPKGKVKDCRLLINEQKETTSETLTHAISRLNAEKDFEAIVFDSKKESPLDQALDWEREQAGKKAFSPFSLLNPGPLPLNLRMKGLKDKKPEIVVILFSLFDNTPDSPLKNAPGNLIGEYRKSLLEASLNPSEEKSKKIHELSQSIAKLPPLSKELRDKELAYALYLEYQNLIKKIRQSSPELPLLLVLRPAGITSGYLDKDALIKKDKIDIAANDALAENEYNYAQRLKAEFPSLQLLNLNKELLDSFSTVTAERLRSFNYYTKDFKGFSPLGELYIATSVEEKIRTILNDKKK